MSTGGKTRLASLWTSTIGLKITMAVSGALLAGFVLFHMLGNLQIFQGPDQMNTYAEFMYGLGGLLWVARLGLLALLVAHVASAVALIKRNAGARRSRYEGQRTQKTTLHAQYMRASGFIILGYIIVHLAHFTFGAIYPEWAALRDEQGRRDVYNYFVLSFQQPAFAAFYIACNVFVASHLSHAMTSVFRTLGVMKGKYRDTFTLVGPAFGFIVGAGNVVMPLACLLGIIGPTVTG